MLTKTARQTALVVGLLLFFFALLSYQANRAGTVATVRGAVLGAVSPAQRLLSSVVGSVTGVWDHYVGLVGAAEEADRLREEVAGLKRDLIVARSERRENARLRELLRLARELEPAWTAASVTARDLVARYSTLTIDRGRRAGVAVDDMVVTDDGAVVGRVVEAGLMTSMVQLVTDPTSALGGRLERSGAAGLIEGADGPSLRFLYIDSRTDVAVGDVVVTSGEDGIYLPDYPIGTVASVRTGPSVPGTPRIEVQRQETALHHEIVVTPAAAMQALETVLVVHRDPEDGES